MLLEQLKSNFRYYRTSALPNLTKDAPFIARLVLAATLSFLLVKYLNPGASDLTGVLSSLLVVQTSLYQTLRTSVQRVVAVLTGVFLAIAVTSWVGLSWWSLALTMTVALMVGSVVNYGDNRLEVPISALLIMGVGFHAEVAAEARLVNTLIGAGVGLFILALTPPRVQTALAASAVQDLAHDAANLAHNVADEMTDGGVTETGALRIVEEVNHSLVTKAAAVEETIEMVEDQVVLNPRTLMRRPRGRTKLLNHKLRTVEFCMDAIKQVATSSHRSPHIPPSLEGALQEAMVHLANALRAFGTLAVQEVSEDVVLADETLADALDELNTARAALVDMSTSLIHQESPGSELWIHQGSILAAIDSVLEELNVDGIRHHREQTLREAENSLLGKMWSRHLAPNLA